MTESHENHIAVTALNCRFPKAPNLRAFWDLLREGREGFSSFDRDTLLGNGVEEGLADHPDYVPIKGVVDDVGLFDAGFFGFSRREAEITDPQHRLFLEMCWEVLEQAGYWGSDLQTGVFAGAGANTYRKRVVEAHPGNLDLFARQITTGNDREFLATLVAYKLDLKGPALNVQSACSTSLTAIHLACQSLLAGECDLALAGAVQLTLPMETGYLHREGMIFSPDGHCRPFDARAAGTLTGNGLGVTALRRLPDALEDGDPIEAVILGSAINNDGAQKLSFSAPTVDGQAALLAEAWMIAGLEPEDLQYVEAHGTGTLLGDPIEIKALQQAAEDTHSDHCIWLGSVKSNIGHLDAAAGMAGFIKTVLAMKHGQIPPSLHFQQPNPQINFQNGPFRVNHQLRSWESMGPRRAGVSAFGIGGANAHLVLEQAPPPPQSTPGPPWQVFPLSSTNTDVLKPTAQQLARHLEANPQADAADMAYTLQTARRHLNHRCFYLCRNGEEARIHLQGGHRKGQPILENPEVFFLFPGQGAQKSGMGMALWEELPVFQEHLNGCLQILDPILNLDSRQLLRYGDPRELAQTRYAQPLLFSLSYALAHTFMDLGIQPKAMAGHSLGELTAAVLAGVFTLPEALEIVVERGRLMQEMEPGRMLALERSEEEALRWVDGQISLAAVNGPEQTTLSGSETAIERLSQQLDREGVRNRILQTSHAFHSPMMEPAARRFQNFLSRYRLQTPQIPFLSNLTGTWITNDQAVDPAYWARHLREPVRFGDNLKELLRHDQALLLEVGSGGTLTGLARLAGTEPAPRAFASLAGHGSGDEKAGVCEALGQLWTYGVDVQWEALHPNERKRLSLPARALKRERFWLDSARPEPKAKPTPKPLPSDSFAQCAWIPSWRPEPLTPNSATPGSCLLVVHENQGPEPGRTLREAGLDLMAVTSPECFAGTLEALQSLPGEVVYLPPASPDKAWVKKDYFHHIVAMARALKALNAPCRITVVTVQVWDVLEAEKPDPLRTVLAGPVRVIPQEWPDLECLNLDLDQHPTDPEAAAWIVDELRGSHSQPLVARRQGLRYVGYSKALELKPAETTTPQLRRNGVYLITGGMGIIGLTLARFLASSQAARVILTSRTPFPKREEWDGVTDPHVLLQIERLEAVEQQGGAFEILSCDVTCEADMREMIARVEARWGSLHGVIHAAGAPGSGWLDQTGPSQHEAVLAPKVEGLQVLEKIFKDKPLDFMALCSSLNAVIGGVGQTDYCAANNVLDAFARAGTPAARHTLSITWGGPWLLGGMAWDQHRRQNTPLSHPLFHSCWPGLNGSRVYVSLLHPQRDWVFSEHRVNGKPTLPGSALVEMARFASAHFLERENLELRDILFLKPLSAQNNRLQVLHTLVEKDQQGVTFKILRPSGETASDRLFVLGAARTFSQQPTQVDLDHLERGMEPVPAPDDQGPISFGPRWKNLIRRSARKSQEGLSHHALPQDYVADISQLGLHPALLDGATGSLAQSNTPLLPSGYARIRIHQPLPARIVSYVRAELQGGQTYRVSLCQPDGQCLVDIEGYQLRPPRSEKTRLTLQIPQTGNLESVRAAHSSIQEPGPSEALIRVVAAALEFKDVLRALGVMPPSPEPAPFGMACSGRIEAVGSDVEDWRPGDEVIAFVDGCGATHVTADVDRIFRKPRNLSLMEAATIPVSFLTAWYALVVLGRLQSGESILIHAGAGGVGQAAIQVARLKGAQIFTTAGSPEKRAWLEDQGLERVYPSRTAAFAERIMEATHGQGVDLVLNSTSGELLDKSLEVLAPFGRFLEIGKKDILENRPLPMGVLDKGVSFFSINAGPGIPHFRRVTEAFLACFEEGRLKPPTHRVFPAHEAGEAFMKMARAEHRGRLVISFEDMEKLAETVPTTPRGFASQQGIAPEEGAELFSRALHGKQPQVIITLTDPNPQDSQSQKVPIKKHADVDGATAMVWAESLGGGAPEPEDDFFAMGGDSLLAISTVARLNELLGVQIPPNSLMQAPTLKALRDLVRQTTGEPSNPVRLQEGDPHLTPLFLIPPAGGDVFMYRDLAAEARNRTVYVFQDPFWSHENTPQSRSVAQLAAAYVALFEKIRPEGSFLLGGASFGGAVALEMARILQARGRKPLRLFLADTPILEPIQKPGNAELLAGLTHVMDYQRAMDQYQGMTDDNMATRFLEMMDMGRRGTRERDKAWVFRFLDIYRINLEALTQYRPQPYAGQAFFFHARDPIAFYPAHPEKAWISVFEDMDLHQVPGNHHTMNISPNAAVLAEIFLKYVD